MFVKWCQKSLQHNLSNRQLTAGKARYIEDNKLMYCSCFDHFDQVGFRDYNIFGLFLGM